MIRKLSVPQLRKFRDGFAEEARYGFGEVLLGWIEAVMGDVCVKGDVCVHDGPEALEDGALADIKRKERKVMRRRLMSRRALSDIAAWFDDTPMAAE